MKRRRMECNSTKKDVRTIRSGSDVKAENRIVIPKQHHSTVLLKVFQMEVTVHERSN